MFVKQFLRQLLWNDFEMFSYIIEAVQLQLRININTKKYINNFNFNYNIKPISN